jgi:hypothetical protein
MGAAKSSSLAWGKEMEFPRSAICKEVQSLSTIASSGIQFAVDLLACFDPVFRIPRDLTASSKSERNS